MPGATDAIDSSKDEVYVVPTVAAGEILTDTLLCKPWNLTKLFTYEDAAYGHLHKILGISCLVHYFYRAYLWTQYGHMGFEANNFTLLMIILHALLSATSFQFHISKTRIKAAPMIYPEFRAHSVAFAYRSLAAMTIHWLVRTYDLPYLLLLRGPIVLLTILIADMITSAHKEQGSTMRGMPFPAHVPMGFRTYLNLFYSVCQVFATTEIIFAFKMDQLFAVLFPIQIAAFLMTCVRKSIISAGAWHFYYALSLLLNFVCGMFPGKYPGGFLFPSAAFVCFFRFVYPVNKYILWALVTAANVYATLYLNRYNFVTL